MKHKNSKQHDHVKHTTGWETHMYLALEVHQDSYSASIYCCSITFTAAQLHRQSGVTDVTARELVLEINNHLLFNVTEVQNLVSSSALATLVHFSATRFLLFGNVHARFLFISLHAVPVQLLIVFSSRYLSQPNNYLDEFCYLRRTEKVYWAAAPLLKDTTSSQRPPIFEVESSTHTSPSRQDERTSKSAAELWMSALFAMVHSTPCFSAAAVRKDPLMFSCLRMLAATAEVETEVADVVVEAAMNAVAIVRFIVCCFTREGCLLLFVSFRIRKSWWCPPSHDLTRRTTQSRIVYGGIATYLVHDNNSGIELQSVDSSHKHRYHI